MKGDMLDLFNKLDYCVKECDDASLEEMKNYKITLDYNEMCAAYHALSYYYRKYLF